MSILCRWASRVEPQAWPSPSPDIIQFVFVFCGHVKYFFNGKQRAKLKFCEEWKEGANRLLTQFSDNVKEKIRSCKQKYLLQQIGHIM